MMARRLGFVCLVLLNLTGTANAAPASGIQLHNHNSGLCLAARAGSGERPVIQTTCDVVGPPEWTDQYWRLVEVNSAQHRWRFRNVALNLCMAARGGSGAGAVVTTCGSGEQWPDQIWTLRYYSLRNAEQFINNASGLCLVARGDREIQAVLTTCDNYPDQFWD